MVIVIDGKDVKFFLKLTGINSRPHVFPVIRSGKYVFDKLSHAYVKPESTVIIQYKF